MAKLCGVAIFHILYRDLAQEQMSVSPIPEFWRNDYFSLRPSGRRHRSKSFPPYALLPFPVRAKNARSICHTHEDYFYFTLILSPNTFASIVWAGNSRFPRARGKGKHTNMGRGTVGPHVRTQGEEEEVVMGPFSSLSLLPG